MKRSPPITGDLAVSIPRFEFIAHYLAVVTAKKGERGPLKYHVQKRHGVWRVIAGSNGVVMYETADAGKLFDFARRTELGYHTRNADMFRADAYLAREGK